MHSSCFKQCLDSGKLKCPVCEAPLVDFTPRAVVRNACAGLCGQLRQSLTYAAFLVSTTRCSDPLPPQHYILLTRVTPGWCLRQLDESSESRGGVLRSLGGNLREVRTGRSDAWHLETRSYSGEWAIFV